MATLRFKNLAFSEQDDKIRITFLKIYYFYLNKKDLFKIGNFKINRNSITFKTNKTEHNVREKFNYLLNKGFNSLKCSLNNKPTLYIHQNSGIPLIGSNSFGIIDRGTNTIEVKPITTCNVNCIFCSVDHDKRNSDVVVENDYLVEELDKVIQIKKHKVNVHIGSQGDPSLYGELKDLVRDIRKNKQVSAISMVTNGILITKKRAEILIKAGMTHFHISLHTLDKNKADELYSTNYPIEKVMEVCKYIAKNAHLLLVPVWLPGINDKDIVDIIRFSTDIKAKIGIQNFLEYKFGKKPVNPLPMKLFYQKIKQLEEELNVDLTTLDNSLTIVEDTKLKKPFKKGNIIDVELKGKTRLLNSVFGVAGDRVVTVLNCIKIKGNVKVKILRDKDNIFIATPVK